MQNVDAGKELVRIAKSLLAEDEYSSVKVSYRGPFEQNGVLKGFDVEVEGVDRRVANEYVNKIVRTFNKTDLLVHLKEMPNLARGKISFRFTFGKIFISNVINQMTDIYEEEVEGSRKQAG